MVAYSLAVMKVPSATVPPSWICKKYLIKIDMVGGRCYNPGASGYHDVTDGRRRM
jgi:hypothetical protein